MRKAELVKDNIKLRLATEADSAKLWQMMCELDNETTFMLYEPDERVALTNSDRLASKIADTISVGDLLLLAETDSSDIIGYLSAECGRYNRTKHIAYIVVGIRQAYQNKGIGKALFNRLNNWAIENKLARLELTVDCANAVAIHLYEKNGFKIEGKRQKSLFVAGIYRDEYYMAKLL